MMKTRQRPKKASWFSLLAGRYDGEPGTPLGSYAVAVTVYNVLLAAFLSSARPNRQPQCEPLSRRDLALLAIATHKVSRVITRAAVTAPFRAPFARFEKYLGYGEVRDQPSGQGWRLSIGEVLTCNYCANMWVGLGFFAMFRKYPTATRAAAELFSAVAAADFLHVFYEATRTHENVLTLEEEQREKQAA